MGKRKRTPLLCFVLVFFCAFLYRFFRCQRGRFHGIRISRKAWVSAILTSLFVLVDQRNLRLFTFVFFYWGRSQFTPTEHEN